MDETLKLIQAHLERTLIDLREPCSPSDRMDARRRLNAIVRALKENNPQALGRISY